MKNYIVVTGGAGFIGSNLIKLLLKKTKYKIISLDNYSTGSKKNHLNHKRVVYIESDTKSISRTLNSKKKKIKTIFHFGEFARIYQSFNNINDCMSSNSVGSFEVFNFCFKNKIKLIYSATSASIGNNGKDSNLSPYAFTKSKNLELLENYKKWFGFKFEIIYFYNVYGPNQIKTGEMATVIGIFEHQYKNNKPLTVVKPGTQTRRFTHVDDTVEACFYAFKINKCRHYSIAHKEVYSILDVAKLFNHKIKFLSKRLGERYVSSLADKNLSNKIYKLYGNKRLKNYINSIKKY